jgi:hypothetical protein
MTTGPGRYKASGGRKCLNFNSDARTEDILVLKNVEAHAMRLCRGFCSVVAFVLVLLEGSAKAQPSMPTSNILTRISMVQSQFFRGSIFSIDVDNREYWITAKHVLNGKQHPPYGVVSEKSVVLKILRQKGVGEQWLDETFAVIDPGNDIDVVVLAPTSPILTDPVPSLVTQSDGLFLGGDCEFLGFPYGGGWRIGTGPQAMWMPFVKHCTVSSFSSFGNEEKRIWVLDGINNEGFSGGPVVFGTGLQQRLFAVVSGFYTEPVEVVPFLAPRLAPEKKHRQPASSKPVNNKTEAREKVDVNSGFIVAFDIAYAIDAIKKNPIGPLRVSK